MNHGVYRTARKACGTGAPVHAVPGQVAAQRHGVAVTDRLVGAGIHWFYGADHAKAGIQLPKPDIGSPRGEGATEKLKAVITAIVIIGSTAQDYVPMAVDKKTIAKEMAAGIAATPVDTLQNPVGAVFGEEYFGACRHQAVHASTGAGDGDRIVGNRIADIGSKRIYVRTVECNGIACPAGAPTVALHPLKDATAVEFPEEPAIPYHPDRTPVAVGHYEI